MWLADLGSRSDGGSNHSISNCLKIFLFPLAMIRIIRLIHIMTHVLLGNCPPSDIGAKQTQGPFCTQAFQLFGAGAHPAPAAQGCAAGLLQSVSVKNVL